jgi:hypothetical protein
MASTPTRDLQEEFLAATRKSQETVVRAIKTWVETVRTVTPKLPSVYVPMADRLPRLPSVTVPFADKLPKPEDVVASGYDFAEHLLALQRKFAEDLLTATEPLIPGTGRTAKAPAAKSEPEVVPAATVLRHVAPKLEFKPAMPQSTQVAEPAPKAVAVPSTPQVPAVKAEPEPVTAEPEPATAEPKPAAAKPAAAKPAAAKPATARKAPAAKSAPRSTAAKPAAAKPATNTTARSAAKPAAPRAPKNTDAS